MVFHIGPQELHLLIFYRRDSSLLVHPGVHYNRILRGTFSIH